MAIEIDIRSDSRQAQQDINRLQRSIENIETGVRQSQSAFQAFGRAAQFAVGAFTAFTTGSVSVRAADTYRRLNTQLSLATTATQGLTRAQQDQQRQLNATARASQNAARQAEQLLFAQREVNRIAIDTAQSLEETGVLYARLNRSAITLGRSQRDTATATRAIAQAITISGASAQAAQAAIIQLGQGLSSGTLRGEELNSVLEQTPRVAQAIADELGVSLGNLRSIAAEGRLTSNVVFSALVNQAGTIAGEFRNVELTFGSAFTIAGTGATNLLAAFDRITGSSERLIQFTANFGRRLNDVANNLDLTFANIETQAILLNVRFRRLFGELRNDLQSITGLSLDFNFGNLQEATNTIDNLLSELHTLSREGTAIIGNFVRETIDLFHGWYIELVGGSIVPDTVQGILNELGMLTSQGLASARNFVNNTIAYFQNLEVPEITVVFSDAAQTLANQINGLSVTDFSGVGRTLGEALTLFASPLWTIPANATIFQDIANTIQNTWNTIDLENFRENIRGTVSSVFDGISVGLGLRPTANQGVQPAELPAILQVMESVGNTLNLILDSVSGIQNVVEFAFGGLSTGEIAGALAVLSALNIGGTRGAVGAVAAPGQAAGNLLATPTLVRNLEAARTQLQALAVASAQVAGIETGDVREYNAALAAQAEIQAGVKNSTQALNGATERLNTLRTQGTRLSRDDVEGRRQLAAQIREQRAIAQRASAQLQQFNTRLNATDAAVAQARSTFDRFTNEEQRRRAASESLRVTTARLAAVEQELAARRQAAADRAARLQGSFREGGQAVGGAIGAAGGFEVGRQIISVLEQELGALPGWAEAGITIGTSFVGQIAGAAAGTVLGNLIGSAISAALTNAAVIAAAGPIGAAIATAFGAASRVFAAAGAAIATAFRLATTGVAFIASLASTFVGSLVTVLAASVFAIPALTIAGLGVAVYFRDEIAAAFSGLGSLLDQYIFAPIRSLLGRGEQTAESIRSGDSALSDAAVGFASGGRVSGPGTGTSDSIPARLSDGEFVVNARAASRNLPLLAAINGGLNPGGDNGRYQEGGLGVDEGTLARILGRIRDLVQEGNQAEAQRLYGIYQNLSGQLNQGASGVGSGLAGYIGSALGSGASLAADTFINTPAILRNLVPELGVGAGFEFGVGQALSGLTGLFGAVSAVAGTELANLIVGESGSLNTPIGNLSQAQLAGILSSGVFVIGAGGLTLATGGALEASTLAIGAATGLGNFAANYFANQSNVEDFAEFLNSQQIRGFASGGKVQGPGSGTSDSIPARLSNGEFVVNARATARNLPLLAAINGGLNPGGNRGRFQDGGLIGHLREFEGFIPHIYTDSRGLATIGIGHLLTANDIATERFFDQNNPLSDQYSLLQNTLSNPQLGRHFDRRAYREPSVTLSSAQADQLALADYGSILGTFLSNSANDAIFAAVAPEAKEVLGDMAFNLGPNFLAGFPGFMRDIGNLDYARAAGQLRDSAYYYQVGRRALNNIDILRNLAGGQIAPIGLGGNRLNALIRSSVLGDGTAEANLRRYLQLPVAEGGIPQTALASDVLEALGLGGAAQREGTTAVQAGEGGYAVARRAGISFNELQALNPGVNLSDLAVGQILNTALTSLGDNFAGGIGNARGAISARNRQNAELLRDLGLETPAEKVEKEEDSGGFFSSLITSVKEAIGLGDNASNGQLEEESRGLGLNLAGLFENEGRAVRMFGENPNVTLDDLLRNAYGVSLEQLTNQLQEQYNYGTQVFTEEGFPAPNIRFLDPAALAGAWRVSPNGTSLNSVSSTLEVPQLSRAMDLATAAQAYAIGLHEIGHIFTFVREVRRAENAIGSQIDGYFQFAPVWLELTRAGRELGDTLLTETLANNYAVNSSLIPREAIQDTINHSQASYLSNYLATGGDEEGLLRLVQRDPNILAVSGDRLDDLVGRVGESSFIEGFGRAGSGDNIREVLGLPANANATTVGAVLERERMELLRSVIGTIGSSDHAHGFAEGGHVRGPGTGTSDSIPARLSNGEFVVNARATARNLPLLSAINGGLNPGGNRGRFQFGGLAGDFNAVTGGAFAPSIQALEQLDETAIQRLEDILQQIQLLNFELQQGGLGQGSEQLIQGQIEQLTNLARQQLPLDPGAGTAGEEGGRSAVDFFNEVFGRINLDDSAEVIGMSFSNSLRSQILSGDFSLDGIATSVLDSVTNNIIDQFTNSLSESVTSIFTDGGEFDLGSITEGLNNVFSKATADIDTGESGSLVSSLGGLFSNALSGIGDLFGGGGGGGGLLGGLGGLFGGGGGGGLFGSIGGLFGGFFNQGGVVPGGQGQPTPIIAHGGEVVLNQRQQQQLFGGASGGAAGETPIEVNLEIVGNVDDATRRAVFDMIPEIASGVQSNFQERGVI